MLSPQFQEKLYEWKQSALTLPVRWTPEDNLHVTIIPPWHEVNVERVKRIFAHLPILHPFSLHFTDIGPGPTPYHPRLLWTTAEAAPQLVALRGHLHTLLKQPTEKRPYIPHVTLGKLFTPAHPQSDIPPFQSSFHWREHIQHIHLVQSLLHKSGAQYKVLATVPLA